MADNRIADLRFESDCKGALCPSAGPVPKHLPPVGKDGTPGKYQSIPSDFYEDPGWRCLKFTMPDPQYCQYSVDADPSIGQSTVRAVCPLEHSTVAVAKVVDGNLVLPADETWAGK